MSISVLFDFKRPRPPLANQHFGLELTPQDLLATLPVPQQSRHYYRPWRKILTPTQNSTIKAKKNKFEVNVDVLHFAPEEIQVNVVDDFIVIEAKHEEKQDEHGLISRRFVRKYPIPENIIPNTINSNLSSDGVLSITASLKTPNTGNERIVPIIKTGPVKKQVEEPKQE